MGKSTINGPCSIAMLVYQRVVCKLFSLMLELTSCAGHLRDRPPNGNGCCDAAGPMKTDPPLLLDVLHRSADRRKNLQMVTIILHGNGLLDSMFIQLCRDGYPINENTIKHSFPIAIFHESMFRGSSRWIPAKQSGHPQERWNMQGVWCRPHCWNPSGHLKPQNHPKLYPNLLLAVISNHI